MPGQRATPERRAQLARQALKEIGALRVRLALQERQASLGLLDRLVLRGCRVFLARWERREQQVLKAPKA